MRAGRFDGERRTWYDFSMTIHLLMMDSFVSLPAGLWRSLSAGLPAGLWRSLSASLLLSLLCLLWKAAAADLKTRKIPNRLIWGIWFSLIGLTFTWQHMSGSSVTAGTGYQMLVTFAGGLLPGFLMLAVSVLSSAFWPARSFGGGDIKLVLAVGSVLGFTDTMTALLLAAVTVIFAEGAFRAECINPAKATVDLKRAPSENKNKGRRERLPFGPYLAAAFASLIVFRWIFS